MKSLLAVMAFLLLFQTPVWGADLHVYTELTGTTAFYQDGELTGSVVEMVREIMRRTGDTTDIEVVPWMRGYDALLKDPNTVLFATTLTEDRKPLFHWVGPLIRLKWQFIARKGQGGLINSLDDARKVKAIATYLGDARDQYLTKLGFRNLDRTADPLNGYRKLAVGRVSLVLGTNIGLQSSIEKIGMNPDIFETAFVFREMDLYIAISRMSDHDLVKRWTDAFEAMRKDGTYERIFYKWYPDLTPPAK